MLSDDEIKRYSRHLSIEGFNEEDQLALKRSKVLIVGAGALGSIVAGYLVGCGVGTLYLVDYDTIDLSNLHRQILYDTENLGKAKASVLSEKLRKLNPNCEIEVFSSMFRNDETSRAIVSQSDVIVECTDNPQTKLLVEKIGRNNKKPVIIGGVAGWSGQVMTSVSGHVGFGDIFGDEPGCSIFAPCSVSGVIGPLPGIVASVQSVEAIKLITGKGIPLIDRLWTFNAMSMEFKTWKIR